MKRAVFDVGEFHALKQNLLAILLLYCAIFYLLIADELSM